VQIAAYLDDDVNDVRDAAADVGAAIYIQQMSDDSHGGGGLSSNVLATRVLPSLIPLAVSPALNIAQVTCLAVLSRIKLKRLPFDI